MADILQARMLAISRHPYLRDAIVSMHPVCTRDVPTAGVDKYWRLYWNPDFVAGLTIPQAAGLVMHELSHLIDRDSERAQAIGVRESNPQWREAAMVWNIASDCVINERHRRAGDELPPDGHYPELHDLPATVVKEEAFRELWSRHNSKRERGDEGKGDNSDGSGADGKGDNSHGSGADGIAKDWEVGPPDERPYGQSDSSSDAESSSVPGVTESQAKLIIKNTAEAIRKAGSRAGAWQSVADSVLDVKVDPRKVFRKALRRALRVNAAGGVSTYRRPSRQQIPGFVLPGKMGVEPNLQFILDTSGSMSLEGDIALAMGFINKTLKRLNMREIDLKLGDTELQDSQSVRKKLTSLSISGRGGTDMGELLKLAAKAKPRPEGIVLITDGYTPWCEPLDIPVFVVLTQNTEAPEWVTSIRLCDIE